MTESRSTRAHREVVARFSEATTTAFKSVTERRDQEERKAKNVQDLVALHLQDLTDQYASELMRIQSKWDRAQEEAKARVKLEQEVLHMRLQLKNLTEQLLLSKQTQVTSSTLDLAPTPQNPAVLANHFPPSTRQVPPQQAVRDDDVTTRPVAVDQTPCSTHKKRGRPFGSKNIRPSKKARRLAEEKLAADTQQDQFVQVDVLSESSGIFSRLRRNGEALNDRQPSQFGNLNECSSLSECPQLGYLPPPHPHRSFYPLPQPPHQSQNTQHLIRTWPPTTKSPLSTRSPSVASGGAGGGYSFGSVLGGAGVHIREPVSSRLETGSRTTFEPTKKIPPLYYGGSKALLGLFTVEFGQREFRNFKCSD